MALQGIPSIIGAGIRGAAANPCSGGLCTNLQASWKLDDTSDATGNGNTLTNHGASFANAGIIGNCATLVAASNQYLSLTSNSYVEMGDIDFSIGAWAYKASNPGEMMIVGKDKDTGRDYFLSNLGNEWNFVVFRGGASKTATIDIGVVSLNTWYCVIGWHDASADTVNITVNNNTPVSTATGGSLDAATSTEFDIGRRAYPSFENYWDGRIDNVNVWKKALSSGDRTAFYNSGAGVEYPYTTP